MCLELDKRFIRNALTNVLDLRLREKHMFIRDRWFHCLNWTCSRLTCMDVLYRDRAYIHLRPLRTRRQFQVKYAWRAVRASLSCKRRNTCQQTKSDISAIYSSIQRRPTPTDYISSSSPTTPSANYIHTYIHTCIKRKAN